MTWLPEATITVELDKLGEHLQPVVQARVQTLRRIIGSEPSTTVGRALAEVFPDAANDEARRRALLRLVDTINEVAHYAGLAVRLMIDGAKREGDRRRVGFVRPAKPQPGGRADLAESVDLPQLGARQAEFPSLKPKVRLALFSAEADLKDAGQLWRPLREALGASREFEFVIREPHSDVRAGDDRVDVFREALQWADYLVLGLSTSLLGEEGWQQSQPDLVQQFVDAGRCLPVALRRLPEHCDLRSFNGRRVFGRDGVRSRVFFEVPAKSRDTFAVALANELHDLIARAVEPSDSPADADRQERARSRTLDWYRVLDRPSLTSAATKGFEAGRTTADIPDVERFLLDWALDPGSTSLLALLGDSGIGKTISAQRLVSGLWEHPGAPTAHYFDLRDLSGIAGWVGIPPVQEVLAACVAGGWTEGGRPLDLDAARIRVAELLADSKIWPTVLVVDGLDEVLVHLSTSDGQKFTNQLLRLRPAGMDPIVGTATKLVLTCRTHYFTDVQSQIAHFRDQGRGQIRKDDYTALALLPITRAQVAHYLAEAMGWDEPRVEAFLGSVHDLWDLGSRPFLLSQLADVIPELHDRQARGDAIVAATVYQAMVQQWLARDSGKHVIQTQHKPDMMAYVAYRLWTTGGRSADVRALGDWLFDFVAAERLERHYAGTPADVLANDLHTATFLVRYDEGRLGLFRFAHSSMAEYFLATWMVRCVERDDRDGWVMSIPSRETLQFFTELLAGHPERVRLLDVLAGWRAPYCRQASEVLLACGIHAWSAGSVEIPLTHIDLHGADLRDLRVSGSAQRPVNLAGADLRGANLDRSQFDHVLLRGANLTGALLNRVIWNEIVTTGSHTMDVETAGALLRRCGPGLNRVSSSARIVEVGQRHERPSDLSLMPLFGHTGGVRAVVVSADGARIVAGGGDGTVRIWDAVTGECQATLVGHTGGVSAVAVSADGARIVSGDGNVFGGGGTVRIWDAVTGECQATLTGHTDWVRGVAISGGGSRIVSGGDDGAVRIWDAVTGECQATFVAVGESWAAWTTGDSAELLGATGDAWRWLRVRVVDDRGRLLSQDPYEWYFPTEGTLSSVRRPVEIGSEP
ncbi:MAG: hypothetical protein QOE53_2082 [Pseudonocardiales bacterium]|nr:hypothetical protein [Pseudonocardiales bacterium]